MNPKMSSAKAPPEEDHHEAREDESQEDEGERHVVCLAPEEAPAMFDLERDVQRAPRSLQRAGRPVERKDDADDHGCDRRVSVR